MLHRLTFSLLEDKMETLFNGYSLDIAPGTFPLSTDSMVLADFVQANVREDIHLNDAQAIRKLHVQFVVQN
jgi:hypothetical protein